MYLARQIVKNRVNFIIRESFQDGDVFRNRDLVDLGTEPQRYIIYPGGGSFYVDEWVIDRLMESGVDADPFELEELFSPFLDSYIRDRIAPFADRAGYRRREPLSGALRRRIIQETHVFDRRRLSFLRFGQTDQSRLNKTAAIYRVLLRKSRDEIEQLLIEMETILRPHEYKQYIFIIFDLQRFFSESYALSMPQALDEKKLDEFFEQEVCLIDRNENFWMGMSRSDRLHLYLKRYVIMYFNYVFAGGSGWNNYIRSFVHSRRRYSPPTAGRRMSMSEVSTIFGVSRGELASLSRRQLIRIYRKKAKEIHPDKGGSNDQFVELANAYNELLRTKT